MEIQQFAYRLVQSYLRTDDRMQAFSQREPERGLTLVWIRLNAK
jgi:hypothetical protein